MKRKRGRALGAALRPLVLPVIAVAALVCFSTAVNDLDGGRAAQAQEQLEQALRRACVASYATEGVYPPDLASLQARSGVQVDETRYVVYYDIFAENLMPDITVLELEP